MSYKNYVHENSRFSEDQKQFYGKNGYLLIKNNVAPDLIDRFSSRFLDICNGNTNDFAARIVKNPSLKKIGIQGQYVVNKIQEFLYDDILWEYASHPAIVDVIENIIGPNITAVHSMLINKPPDSDPDFSLHPLHQDLQYFPFRPANRIAASWTAMERVDQSNGCLYVVPGSHLDGILYKHETSKHTLYDGVQGKEHLEKVHVVMEKGDTVFFHPLLLHGSGPNSTKGFRKAISCHYADTNCYFIDVRGTDQEDLMKRIEELSVKLSAPLHYVDIWKAKSRLVRGPPGNFQKLDSHL
ncbi:unnamed protein product [Callosobruchus maculatus]|uniref:phytanoyl-CoA dioxygenase n=1 Tax=Callosobruchus maculatus TaxID=64391 RepID=A0A653D2M6_CALMS|nr:unnamed protein product [Callosobruchus maculatus]